MTNPLSITPLLVVRDAPRAIDFYVRALDAVVTARFEHGPERRVSHADLALGGTILSVTEELRAWNSDAPPSLGGSPVVLQLAVDDADRVLASMADAGATVLFPAQDLLGERMARLRDPFGHLWLLRQQLVALSTEEIQRQRDALFASYSSAARPGEGQRSGDAADGRRSEDDDTSQGMAEATGTMPGATLHLVVGPVGAGKSTFATRLAQDHRAVRLTLDDWMARLFRPDRPESDVVAWYVERAARCVDQIAAVADAIAPTGVPVVLEIGLLRREERQRFYRSVEDRGHPLVLHVVDAPREVRRERVARRNVERGPTFSMVVPPEVFELASDLWEPPDEDELRERAEALPLAR
jgi:predicted kinase/uncharacterized glyoxalase superfamily protein PhnB